MLNTLLILLFVLPGAIEIPDAKETRSGNATPTSEPFPAGQLVEFPGLKFAYVEHTGPYWSLGPIIERVAVDRKTTGHTGPLVVRYLHDSGVSAPNRLKAQIGYEIGANEEPRSPYHATALPTALTANKTVLGSDGLSTRHFAALKFWALTQDLAPDGDMIALVTLSENDRSTNVARTELFLPVCVPDPVAPARPEVTAVNPGTTRSGELLPPHESTPSRIVTKVIPLEEPKPVAPEDAEDIANVEVVPEPAGSVPVIVLEPEPRPQPVAKPKPHRVLFPIHAWIEAGSFDEVALALLPDSNAITRNEWADQLAARAIALAGGVQKQWPDEGGWLTDLAASLSSRRATLRRQGAKGTTLAAPKAATTAQDPEMKNLTREFDLMMGQVAYRTITPEQVRERLSDLLEKAANLETP